MSEQERNISEIDEYMGLGETPVSWIDRVQTLRTHKKNFLSGGYDEDTYKELYLDGIESIKNFVYDLDLKRAQKRNDKILDFYPGWETQHFKQLLIQLGELE